MLSFIKRDKTIFLLLFVYYLFIVFITPASADYDLKGYLLPWIRSMLEGGIQYVYKNPLINYPPISLYVLYFFGIFVDALKADLETAIYHAKNIFFLFDIATFYVIIKIMQRFKVPLVMMLIFLCNIAVIYNSVFWGQLDAIYTFFVLLSVYFALTKRPLWSIASLVCALGSKPQAMLFIPVIVLVLVPYFYKKPDMPVKAFLVIVSVLVLIFLPFLIAGTVEDYVQIVRKTTDYYPKVSMYAFNFWLLLFGVEHITRISDSGTILGVTYRVWGLGMFGLWSLAILYPLFTIVRSQIKHMRELTEKEWQIVFLSLTLLTVVFFFFNTQMHERYVHAAVIFACVYALLSKRYVVYSVLSIAYITNLANIHKALYFNPSTFIKPEITALLFAGVIIYGTFELYYVLSQSKKHLHIQTHTDLTR